MKQVTVQQFNLCIGPEHHRAVPLANGDWAYYRDSDGELIGLLRADGTYEVLESLISE